MENISAAWLYPLIAAAGVLQAWGPPMNGALRNGFTNPWLASVVSFLPVVFFLSVVWFCIQKPMPSGEALAQMPWWAPLGGLVGSFAVIAGLLFVDKVGAGVYAGLTITANIIMSLAIDNFGMFGMSVHTLNLGRIIGGLLLIAGVSLVAIF